MRGKCGDSVGDPHAVSGSTAAESRFNFAVGNLFFVLKPAPRKHLLRERVRILRCLRLAYDVFGRVGSFVRTVTVL